MTMFKLVTCAICGYTDVIHTYEHWFRSSDRPPKIFICDIHRNLKPNEGTTCPNHSNS